MVELQEQNMMRNQILVMGFPKISRSENLRSIFRKICYELGVNIGSNGIVNIYRKRNNFSSFIVELEDFELKEMIKRRVAENGLRTRDIDKTSKCPNMNIKIVDALSESFFAMVRFGNRAIADHLIVSVDVTSKGVLVKRYADREGRYFLLLEDLEDYIRHLKQREGRRNWIWNSNPEFILKSFLKIFFHLNLMWNSAFK